MIDIMEELNIKALGWGGFITSWIGSSYGDMLMFILGLLFLLLGIYNRIQHVIINQRRINELGPKKRTILARKKSAPRR